MKKLLLAAALIFVVTAPILVFAFAPAPDAGSKPVEFKTLNGYAESPDSGLKGDYSCLALTAKSEFDRVFNPVLTPRGLPDPASKAAFDSRLFVAVIKRSEMLWEFKVEKVTVNGETLTVSYRATPRQNARGDTRKPRTTEKVRRATEKATAAPKTTAKAATTAKAGPSTSPPRGASATFDSPLILSVPSDKYLTVVFIENGQRAGSARVGN